VRVGDALPAFVRADGPLGAAVADEVRSLTNQLTNASLGVIAPDSMIDDLSEHLTAAGVNHGTATRTGLDEGVTLVPVSVVKGLELDAVIVVEPARIVADHEHGLRSLYVALTRPTQRLSIVHAEDLPDVLR
jgi:superfamily I DNA/RNA helicase